MVVKFVETLGLIHLVFSTIVILTESQMAVVIHVSRQVSIMPGPQSCHLRNKNLRRATNSCATGFKQ
jgi:hypothetical protein